VKSGFTKSNTVLKQVAKKCVISASYSTLGFTKHYYVKSTKMRQIRHVACMAQIRKVLVARPEGNKPFSRLREILAEQCNYQLSKTASTSDS
jgi:hypothetical protein